MQSHSLEKFVVILLAAFFLLEGMSHAFGQEQSVLQKALGDDYKIYDAFHTAAHCSPKEENNSLTEPPPIEKSDLEKALREAGLPFGSVKKQFFPDFVIEQANRNGTLVKYAATRTRYWPYLWTFYLNDREIIKADNLCRGSSLQAASYDGNGSPRKLSILSFGQTVSIDLKPEFQPIEEVYGCEGYKDKDLDYLKSVASDLERIAVAVIDDGFDYNDKMLAYKIDREGAFDAYHDDAKPYFWTKKLRSNALFEPSGHGSGVAGITARGTDKIKLIPISYYESSERSILSAVDRAKAKGARVVNLSFGGKFLKSICQKIEENPDILFIAGAGNENEDLEESPFYPAACQSSNLVTVGSVSESGQKSDFSSFGKNYVHLGARGEKIQTTLGLNLIGEQTGTSFAAPQVANVAAKIFGINPNLHPSEVKEIILSTVIKRNQLSDFFSSSGELDEQAALEKARLTQHGAK